jgi:hypothetical protein
MFPTSPLLFQQVLDGLLRMVHHLPEHMRNDMHMSLQIFPARFKLKETILPMAMTITTGAIAQPDLLINNGAPASSASTSSVMLNEPHSEVRHITYGFGQPLPAPRTTTAIAMVARQSYPGRKRVSVPTTINSDPRRDDRHDNGRDPRQDPSAAQLLPPRAPSPLPIFR